MVHPLRNSIIRIVSEEQTVGAGFFLQNYYACTCTHVLDAVRPDAVGAHEGTIITGYLGLRASSPLRFQVSSAMPAHQSGGDVATLRLVSETEGVGRSRLGLDQIRTGWPFEAC